MAIAKELFENMREIFPDTTCRSFSRSCGMSEGYYGSVTTRQLPISTNALIHLAEVLEHKKVLARDMTPRRLQQVEDMQERIAAEVARRAKCLDCTNLPVRKMLMKALARVVTDRGTESGFPLMPTMMFR